jgi:hypothetical protein
MQDVFQPLELADYYFLAGLIESNVNLTNDQRLRSLLADYEEVGSPEVRAALDRQLEREIRYLGSAEIAYLARYVMGQEPGVSFHEVVRDAARALSVQPPHPGSAREQVESVVEQYVTQQFAGMPREAQQQMLEDLGVQQDKAAAFLKRSAGVFAVPALVEAFGIFVVDGLIKNVIFGAIGKLIGRHLSMQLFQFIAGRFPWWVRWIGPAAWTASIGWTVLDLQGPALRKTAPVVLYLGLCSMRRHGSANATSGG